MRFIEFQQDEHVQQSANIIKKIKTGYLSMGLSDSGSPYWTSRNDQGIGTRCILVAVHSGVERWFNEAQGTILEGDDYVCRAVATKINDEIGRWIDGYIQDTIVQ